nr:MAG TPA: hypothetical protein [Caudoviricetes sp.]
MPVLCVGAQRTGKGVTVSLRKTTAPPTITQSRRKMQ